MLMLNSRNVMLSGLPSDRRSIVLRLRQGGAEPSTLRQDEALFVNADTAIGPGQTLLHWSATLPQPLVRRAASSCPMSWITWPMVTCWP